MELSGKRIVVTGSSRGIGRATALRVARDGAHVVLHGRGPSEQLASALAEVRGFDPAVECYTADFGEPGAALSFLDNCLAGGAVDGWVHAAGADVLTTQLRHSAAGERLAALWRVDVAGMLELLPELARRIRGTPGVRPGCSVITIGWDQALQGMEGEAGWIFGAVKGAVAAATLAMAQTFSPALRFNCIAPGWIRTAWGENAEECWQTRAREESLAGRWGRPGDVASLAAWLLRDESGFVNGQVLNVNGGFRFGRPERTRKEGGHG